MSLEITFNESYYRKTDPENYVKSIGSTVSDVVQRTMEECQNECPVRTGNLRDSHSVETDEESMTGSIHNSAEYWIYVVYGTVKMASNNYPSRAWSNIVSQDVISTIFKSKLNENGIDTL